MSLESASNETEMHVFAIRWVGVKGDIYNRNSDFNVKSNNGSITYMVCSKDSDFNASLHLLKAKPETTLHLLFMLSGE